MKAKITLTICFLLLVFANQLIAAKIDSISAKKIAIAYYYEAYAFSKGISYESLQAHIQDVQQSADGNPLLYFVNIDPTGYLIVSGDDRAYPVLSYSTSEKWSDESLTLLPPAALDIIDGYTQQMEIIIRSNVVQSDEIRELWNFYAAFEKGSRVSTRATGELEALGNLQWSQRQFYNDMCPETGGIHPTGNAIYGNRCPAGCVALAMAQIMRYWEWPQSGESAHSYDDPENFVNDPCDLADPSYGEQSADFSAANYNWSNMPNTINTANNDVAQIIRHAGVAANMDYIYCASGSNINNARNAFVNHFGYAPNATVLTKTADISWFNWEKMIKAEVEALRPVYYRGTSATGGGHALAIWAYEEVSSYFKFKFNWGWAGTNNDTWYTLRTITGEDLINYSNNQSVIQGLYPQDENTIVETCPDMPTVEYEGQTYNTIKIDNHCWIKENLNVGSMLQSNQGSSNNGIIEKYCYNNNPQNCETYGALYSWDEMMQYTTDEGAQGICPDGWHIATDEEWQTLSGNIDSQFPAGDPVWNNTGWRGSDAGGKMKSVGINLWKTPNIGATNQSGITAHPGGNFNTIFNSFREMGDYAYFWSSTPQSATSVYYHRLDYNDSRVYRQVRSKGFRLSVRCMREAPAINLVNLSGHINDALTGVGISNAHIILTGSYQSYEIFTQQDGFYTIESIEPGTYNISILKSGYHTLNKNIQLSNQPNQTHNASLTPVNSNYIDINSELTAYAETIVENPANVFTLSGEVSINNILYFVGNVILDKRPSNENFLIKGNNLIFVLTQSGQYNILDLPIPWEFSVDNHFLIVNNEANFFDIPILVQGFPLSLNAIDIDPDGTYASALVIPKFPFPLDEVIAFYKKPKEISEFSFALKFDDEGQHLDDVEFLVENFNLKLFKIKTLHIGWDYDNLTFAGQIAVQIPGDKKKNPDVPDYSEIPEYYNLPVEIIDSTGNTQQVVSLIEFVNFLQDLRAEPLVIELEIEFIAGKINKLTADVDGIHIPLPIAGMALTRIKGGVDDLATEQMTLILDVNIETGFEIPIISKSPLTLKDFGVTIKPWNYFEGHGTIEIIEKPVSGGYIKYVKNNGLDLNGWLNAKLIRGNIDLGISRLRLAGNSMLEISTPPKDQIKKRKYKWLGGVKIGTFETEFLFDGVFRDYYITTTISKDISFLFTEKTLKLVQQFSFDDKFPHVHLALGVNNKKMLQIFKGEYKGKNAIQFMVPENTPQMLIIAEDTINPSLFYFSLQNPNGQIFDTTNAYFEQDSVTKQSIMVINEPMKGNWFYLTDYEGNDTVYLEAIDQEPTMLALEPQSRRTRSNFISLNFSDYADTLKVEVYFDSDDKGFNGTLIDIFSVVNNGNLDFIWHNDDLANGEYFIYSRVDDGKNKPVLQYAPGSIWVENDPDIEIPQAFSAVQVDTTVVTTWNKAELENTIGTVVYYKDISTGHTNEQAVIDQNEATLYDLIPGREYELWTCFINENSTYSEPSNKVNLIIAARNRNNPPYFTIDPDRNFVFVVGEEMQYTLSANDADGDNLFFNAPDDTLGLIITGDQLSWTPTEEQKGVYNLLLTVTDGADNDTTFKQLVVYTQQQVRVDLAFSSVNLYESDNMFVKIKNYFCQDYYQQTTVRNIRTQEEAIVDCRRVDDFNYIGQFDLSFINRSEISVANGDTIEVGYSYDNQEYLAYAYYDSMPQPSDQIPPGVIEDLTLTRIENNRLKLKWTATGNDGEVGKAYKYDIRFAYEPITSEGIYFTAFLIEEFPYPSMSGEQDSLIINLANLADITQHENIYFSIKAEDEMQNRGGLSNSPGINCLLNPYNVNASIADVYKIHIQWSGPMPDASKEGGVQYYNLYRKFNQDSLSLYQTNITTLDFIDNLKVLPDGNYLYAIQAVYSAGESDIVFSQEVNLQRFVNMNVLCQLEDTTNFSGISFIMAALDTVYAQSFARTTNPTGLILLNNVFKSGYSVEIAKEGFESIFDTITVSDSQKNFSFMLLDTLRIHPFSLPAGWSGISSYIKPYNEDIETLLAPILSDLIILQSETGMYWPGEKTNTIFNWNTHEGYKIKMANAVELTISGTRETDKTLQLSVGWNLIPVLSECAVDVEVLFAEKDLVMVKEVAGWNLYWPEFGINTLGGLLPGKAYFVLMGSEEEIEFSECDGFKFNLSDFGSLTGLEDIQTPWQTDNPTSSSHTVALTLDSAHDNLNAGDIIGAFDMDGNCNGMAVWQNQTTAITLFGNDPTTAGKDGFNEGEFLRFKLFRPFTDEVFLLDVKFDPSSPNAEKIFVTNGISSLTISDLKFELSNSPTQESSILINPNPAKDEINVRFENSDFINNYLNIYSPDGRLLKSILINQHDFTIQLNDFSGGMYIIQVGSNSEQFRKKLIIQ
jgi:uncharacterized protein (TIGR02145 family)